ncbi:MAG: NAD(+)/NADH kinase [Anaerolineae bacterium]|nr:MAG: NAD(+)/NADH kinase [Anaerolineae bacterium]
MDTFTRIAVAAHPQIPQAYEQARQIAAFLEARGCQATYNFLDAQPLRAQLEGEAVELLIALGGDGTMLRAGRLCAPHHIPILGINMGKFGFLMEINLPAWQRALERVLQGDFWLEKRMLLCAEHWRGETFLERWHVLNEVVVSRGETVRPVHLETYVDGRFLTTYVADGLIVATPTGSTAYALAAGGPILPPELRNLLLVPVAPHLSIDRAIVLAEGSSVTVTVRTDHQAVISCDGHPPIHLRDKDRVAAHASDYSVAFIRLQDPGYFYRNLTPHMYNNPATRNLP